MCAVFPAFATYTKMRLINEVGSGALRRRAALWLLLLDVLGACSCSASGDNTEHGGGTFVPWNSYSVLIDAENGTFASVVIGLSAVEVITVSDEHVDTYEIKPNRTRTANCVRAPMTLALVEGADLAVQDPCGSWTASRDDQGIFRSKVDTLVESTAAQLYAEPLLNGRILVLGTANEIGLLNPQSGQSKWISLPGLNPTRGATKLFVSIGRRTSASSTVMLVQRREALLLSSVSYADGEILVSERMLQQHVKDPYLRPFDSYDQITSAFIEGCPMSALGVGMFDLVTGDAPRRVQVLELSDEDLANQMYVARELQGVSDVIALAVVDMPHESEFIQILGVIEASESGHVFSLLGRRTCDEWIVLSRSEIDFDLRTPESPAWGSVRHVPLTEHVVLVGTFRSASKFVEFYHYDGYDLRIFRASVGSWQLAQRTERIHDDRVDLSLIEASLPKQ